MNGILVLISLAPLHAGSVIFLANGPGADGKLTLNSTTIRVDGPSAQEIDLAKILEADFTETPFHLDYFSSHDNPDRLPLDWESHDTVKNDTPGSFSYANGVFTLISNSHVITDWSDASHAFYVGRPWTGNARLTLRVKEFDPENPRAVAGGVLCEGFDGKSEGMYEIGANGSGEGIIFMHGPSGGYYSHRSPMVIPFWLRLTRNGTNLEASVSSDGKNWEVRDQTVSGFSINTWAGLFISNGPKPVGKDVIDQVTFTPGPCESDLLPRGVLLRSGSYLAGNFGKFDIAGPDSVASFHRNDKVVSLSAAQIAIAILHPTTRRQIADNDSQTGLLLKNGDFITGDIQSISPGDPESVRINSLTLGITDLGERFGGTPIQGVFFHTLEPQPSAYEIRLTDGSIIRATSVAVNGYQIVIAEASGISVTVDPNEIAQFRAGPFRVQSLLELPWKTIMAADTASESTPKPGGVTNVAPTGAVTAATNPTAAANSASSQVPPVDCWEGNQQEQIMVAATGTRIDFPLTGKFRSLAMKMALSPDSPSNALATLRVMADGKEVGHTPPIKDGDSPRLVEFTLQEPEPKTVSLVVDSIFPGTRDLIIDPVAIRNNQN